MEYKGMPFNKSGWSLHMMPVGYLMIEHRLIERMIKLLMDELLKIDKENKADLRFIEAAIDFLKTYADKCHHGKEEDILFRELVKKKLSPEHKMAMEELIEEHKMGRKEVGKLVEAQDSYREGDTESISSIKKQIKWLVEFYHRHIAKEDKKFFILSMSYFSKQEQDNMLGEFLEFDKGEVQETYRKIVLELEKERGQAAA
jgi:hemerythrin-like domain-containing protein